jgi:hypothetical protein
MNALPSMKSLLLATFMTTLLIVPLLTYSQKPEDLTSSGSIIAKREVEGEKIYTLNTKNGLIQFRVAGSKDIQHLTELYEKSEHGYTFGDTIKVYYSFVPNSNEVVVSNIEYLNNHKHK